MTYPGVWSYQAEKAVSFAKRKLQARISSVIPVSSKDRKSQERDHTMSHSEKRKRRKLRRKWKRECRHSDRYDPTDEQLGVGGGEDKPLKTMPVDGNDDEIVFFTDGEIKHNNEWLQIDKNSLRPPEPEPTDRQPP